MTLKQYEYVQTLSRTLNFTLAAEELGITQPSLSQYIKKIEKEIGMDLFIRNGQDIRLTDAGVVFLDAGRRIMDIEHRMNSDLLDIATHKSGSLIVGTSPFRSASMMPEIVRQFQKYYPDIHIIVQERTTAELLDGMEHGAFDLCLTVLPVSQRLFEYETVTEEEIILAVPKDYPLLESEIVKGRRYPAINTNALNGRPFVMITDAQVMQKELNNLRIDYNLNLKKVAVVKSLAAQISMVRAGVGMALLPVSIARLGAKDEVRFYSFKQEIPRREVIALWSKSQPLTQTARAFVDCMKRVSW